MSLEKIGNFVCFTENNTASGISGDGVTEPIGLDSNVYPEYNETCLFSSVYSCQTGNLSDSFAKYQRLRLRVGWHNNSTTTNEGDSYLEVTPAPSAGANVAAIWNVATSSPGYICVGRINFPTLSSFNGTYGKLCDMNGNTGNTGWEGKLRPIKEIWGINKLSPYRLCAVSSEGGTVSGIPDSGYAGDVATITAVPESDSWRASAINISGSELTGNTFMFGNSNVSAQAEFEHSKNLTLVPNEHATLSADKMTGFSGDIVTVSAVTDEGWYFTGMNVTGATATGNKFMFVGENVTAEGLYTDEGFPIVYENDGHGTLTGDTDIGIPGQPVNLTTSYNTYYRFSGYQVTGGYIQDGKLYATAACTAKANYSANKFTATGNWEKGSNVSQVERGANRDKSYTSPNLYILHGNHTGAVPTAWYATSNRWKPTDTSISGYSITLKPSLKLYTQGNTGQQRTVTAYRDSTSIGTYSPGNNTQWSTTITQTTINANYSIKFYMRGRNGNQSTATAGVTYNTTSNTGTWTATGYIP